MEIERLQLILTDEDLNNLARKHLAAEEAVEELEVKILPEGVRVKGVYQVFVPVTFEALWELGVEGGKAMARLAVFRAMGMPANILKSLIVKMLADVAKQDKWLQVDGEVVRVDLDELLKKRGLSAQTNLNAINCQPGRIVIKAGNLR